MGRVTQRRRVERVKVGESTLKGEDILAVEEPLEIRINGRAFSVTMRTPGADFDLVAGFLVSEGIVSSSEQLAAMRYCAGAQRDFGAIIARGRTRRHCRDHARRF